MQDQIDAMMAATGMDVYENREPGRGGFKFVIPGISLSSNDVTVTFEAGQWVLTYVDADRTWTGRADDKVAAYLDLIADRCGLHEANEE